MCNEVARSRLKTGVMIDEEQLEGVTERNEISKKTGQRITSGWRRFGEYRTFLKDRKIPICLKIKIMDTIILPAMVQRYGL